MNSSDASSENAGSAPISLARVRSLFARPARVQASDFLRREVAGRMFERLELIRVAPGAVLDAGCGEGADLPVLQQRFPQAQVLGLDAAPAMLACALERQKATQSSMSRLFSRLLPKAVSTTRPGAPDLLCADYARLPFAANAFSMLWSNLALHWHPHPDQVFQEWRRVLATEGLLMFSCFGPDTMRQLREIAGGSGVPAVLPFVDMHDLGDMLVQAGFATPVMDMEMLTLTYDSADKLLADVRSLGGNPLPPVKRGLGGRALHEHIYRELEGLRQSDGKLALSIEVIYGHAFRPVPKTTSSGEAIVRFTPRRPS